MKKLSLLLFVLAFSWLGGIHAQTIVVGASPMTLPCGGGNVNLTALGSSTVPVFGDNFNNGSVAPGWMASPAAQFDNPCGASFDGTTYLWMGSATAAPRQMVTASVDVSCGGTVCFDFKFVCESCGDTAPCEGADTYAEGVSLQCSTNGGATWIDIAYFAPNGDLLVSHPGVGSPYASGNTPFTTWQNYCFTIPAGCETANTQFRLYQWGSSGAIYDHWGIDNFYVYANPCAPYYYDWAHIPGAPDAPNVTTNITQTTTFTCCYTNGITSACESVTVVVNGMTMNPIVTTTEPCLGDNAGTATISVTGGTAPFSYALTGPTPSTNGTGSFSNLAPGNYTITVTDGGGCTVTNTFTITPGIPCCTLSTTSTPALCFGQASGTGTANPANGVPPYTYLWSPSAGSQTTQTANNLPAGTYSVTITDASGCTQTQNVTVTQPTALAATATPTNPLCFGACNGQIAITAPSGGTPGYTYNIGGGAFGGSATFTGLCAGTFNVILQDANGCQLPFSGINLTQPTDVTLVQSSVTPATCGASNGALTVTAGGGTPPYQYSTGGPQQGSPTFNSLASGAYNVTVTDANGCTEVVAINVPSSAGPAPFVDVVTNVACAGAFTGSVTIGVAGGSAPYTFTLNPPGVGQASNTFNGVPAGAFTVQVVDANGCIGTVAGNITQPTSLSFTSAVTNALCNGSCDGQINITASNATPPYSYSDDNGLTFQPGNVLTGLCAGNINVVVSDANGCLANAVVVMGQPTPLTLAPTMTEPSCNGLSDGTITFNGGGGIPAYTYSVNNGTSFTGADPVTGIAAGNYNIVIQDANGCQTPGTILVTEPPAFTFTYIANNPSNCGANDGSFEIAATNGLAPYLYSINGGTTQQPSGLFQFLFSGLYLLYVTDANGCVDSTFSALSDNVMITQVDVEQATTCYNACDGVGIVSQMFGSAPFNYTINTGGSQPFGVFANLCAGQHFVTIEDNGLCIGIQEINIAEPDTIEFTPIKVNVTCPGGSDGQINFGAVTGGTGGPYTFSIDGGATYGAASSFAGLPIGTYTLFAQDGNGCLGSTTITLTEPAPWDVVINQTDLTCFQNNTGFVQIVGGGSTAPYTYNLNGVVNGIGVYALLAASPVGGYPVTVTDVNGCVFNTTQVVNEPPLLTAGYALTNPLCYDGTDGTIVVTPAGGTAPYLYSSNNGVFFQSIPTLANLADGCYDVMVEDDNGCQVVSNQCLAEPSLTTMTMVMNPATCGANNADVTITAANGTPGYTYSVDNGVTFQAGTFFGGLSAINYIVVVEDNNGCQIDSLITLSADAQPAIDNIVFTDPLCNGSLDGTITVTSSGGVGAHTYSLNLAGPYAAPNTFGSLGAGVYDVYVQDANGCIATVQVTLTDPPVLTLASVPTHLTCNNNFTGALALSQTGGTAPYQFSIDNGVTYQGGGTFSFQAAGLYNIAVQDANGCITTGTETITEPAVLAWTTFTIVDAVCFGACDGTVNTVVGGGTPGFTYNWSGNIAGNAAPNATGICAGTYSLLVTDANGCQIDSNNFVVGQPPMMVITSVVATDLLCFGDNTGQIDVVSPTAIDYAITGPVTTNNATGNFTGLPIGNYDITVTDATGCTAVSNTTVYQPTQVYAQAPSDWTSCYGEVGAIQAFSNGGTVPYTFSWTNDVNANVETTQIFNYPITQTTIFTLVVTDANGCVAVPVSYTVTPTPPLALVPSVDTMICLGGSAVLNVTVTGGQFIDFGSYQGYGYSWDTGVAGDTLASVSVSPFTPTTYTITVTDLCGEFADTTIDVGIHPDPIVPVLGPFNGCAPDTMDFDITANVLPGYTVSWDLGNGTTTTSANPTGVVYPNAGSYDMVITITTDQGCTITNASPSAVNIYDDPIPGFYTDPNSPSILNPTIQIVDISQNAVIYNYTFEGFGSSSVAEPTITFPVTEETTVNICQRVTSAEGCVAQVCVPLEIHEEIIFYVPNIFTPDGDLFNEIFFPVFTSGVDPYDYHMTIFNRWGEIVFESYNFDFGWNGHYGNGGLVDDGVYIWQIEFGEKLSDKKQTHRGHVTVLK